MMWKVGYAAFVFVNMVCIFSGFAQDPVAVADFGTTPANTSVSINIVANDYGGIDAATVDLDPTKKKIQDSKSTSEGKFEVNDSGIVTFTPKEDFMGIASITYTVNDTAGKTSNVTTITITVTAPNNSPQANDDTGTTLENTSITINVVANDADSDGYLDNSTLDLNPSQSGIQNSVSNSQGTYIANSSGMITFTPISNFSGTATTSYTIQDNSGATSNLATVQITVTSVNSAPVANYDHAQTNRNTSITIPVLLNDSDQDGSLDNASVDLDPPENGIQKSYEVGEGTFTVDQNGIVTYAPKKDFSGLVTIQYVVRDNEGASSNVATINIMVGEESQDLDIPTGFTPNGDGANETWKITAKEGGTLIQFDDAKIRVYSKRGLMVYSSRGFENQWDGTHDGKPLPADSYYYVIELGHGGRSFKGIVTILR